jgi:uncharacterized delta-60 repeat protein
MGSQIINNIPFVSTSGTTKINAISATTANVGILKGAPNISVITNNLSFSIDPSTLISGGYDSSLVVGGGFSSQPVVLVEISNKIYVGGSFTYFNNITNLGGLISLNDDGTKNTSFNPAAFNSIVSKLTSISGGTKILVSGSFTTYSGSTNNRLIRLNINGTKDTTFNIGSGFNNSINRVGVQSDGKYVIIGAFTTFTGQTNNRVIRLNSNGSKDSTYSFGTGFGSTPTSLAIQSDNKAVIGGSFTTFTGATNNRIIRLNTNGSKDTTFATGTGFNSTVNDISIDTNGKIYIGGSFTTFTGATNNRIIRLNTNGSIDTAFATGTGFDGIVNVIVIDTNGKIMVGGQFGNYNGSAVPVLARLNTNGTLDTSFNLVGFTTSNVVSSIAIRANGNYVFTHSNAVTIASGNKRKYVTEVTSTGAFVSSYVIKNSGFNSGSVLNVIKNLSTNKILIGGNFSNYDDNTMPNGGGLIRLNNDYTFDSTFNYGRPSGGQIRDIQSISGESKYLLSGDFTTYSGASRNRFAMINSTGSLDANFTIGSGFDNSTYISKQSLFYNNGRIYVGGNFSTYSGVTTSPTIIRLMSNGKVDATFNISEINAAFMDGSNSFYQGPVTNIYESSTNGKIIITGSDQFFFSDGTDILGLGYSYNNNIALRLTTGGTIDLSYGYPSGMTLNFIGNGCYSVQQSNGGIVFVGAFNQFDNGINTYNLPFIFRLDSNGHFDTAFNSAVGTGFNVAPSAINLDIDGGFLVSGSFTSFNGHSANGFVKLNSDGSYNASVIAGTGFPIGSSDFTNISTVIPYKGEYLIGGSFNYYQGNLATDLVLLGSAGSGYTVNVPSGIKYATDISSNMTSLTMPPKIYVDNLTAQMITGGTNGISKAGRFLKLGGNLTGATTIGLGSNSLTFTGNSGTLKYGSDLSSVYSDRSLVDRGFVNSIVGTGSTTVLNSTTVVSNFGTVDPSYATGTTFNSTVLATAFQTDGRILVGGQFTTFKGGSQNRLIRLNNDGSKDTSFNVGTGFDANVLALAIQTNGKILVGGQFTTFTGSSSSRIIRLNSDGSKDTTFTIGSGFSGSTNNVNVIALQSDGKVIVGGTFTSYSGVTKNGIVRLNTNGTIDSSFNVGSAFGASPAVLSLAIQSDGKIIVGHSNSTYSGTSVFTIIRLNTNGSLDTSFNIGSGFNFGVLALAIQSTGKIIAGGNFDTFSTSGSIRFNTDGSRDTTFNSGTGFNGSVRTIVILDDDRVIVGGDFTQYNGVAVNNYLLSLNKNGGLDTSLISGTFNNVIDALAIGTTDRTIAVGGQFITLNSTSYGRFIKLNYNSFLNTKNLYKYSQDNTRYFTSARIIPDIGFVTGTTYLGNVTTDIKINSIGKGLYVKEGTNATSGIIILTGGTAVVNTNKVTASSRIQLTSQVDGGTPGFVRVSTRTAGTSFTITSSSVIDTSQIAWFIVEPA